MFRRKPPEKGPRGEVLPDPNEGPPDSRLPSGMCPRCGKQSSFQVLGSLPATWDLEILIPERDGRSQYDLIDRVSSLQCRHCHQCTVVVEEQWVGDAPRRQQRFGGAISFHGIHWWPLPVAKLSQDIPLDIASAFTEALHALSADCPRASAVMARRTLEAITVDKGITSGVLADRLKTLAANGVLTPALADWSKEVRLVGNIGAHFDPMQKVTVEDAQQLNAFIRELLRYLYELPAELLRRRSQTP